MAPLQNEGRAVHPTSVLSSEEHSLALEGDGTSLQDIRVPSGEAGQSFCPGAWASQRRHPNEIR